MGITLFTPTYNRAYTLKRLYTSLCKQNNKDFEWLIIDDGSTDETRGLIEKFISEGLIKIRYFFQENAGKSMAHNKGVELAAEELFACIDSDDYLVPEAVEMVLNTWEKVKDKAVGIVAKRKTVQGVDITKMNLQHGNFFVLREAYNSGCISGDTFLVFKTAIIKLFSFPCIENEKFVPEDYLYDKIGTVGKLYLLNESIYVCEYLPDGYTQNMSKLIAKNPKGYRAYVLQRIDLETSLRKKFANYIRYESISFVIGEDILLRKEIGWCILTILPGYILYRKRFAKYKKSQTEGKGEYC